MLPWGYVGLENNVSVPSTLVINAVAGNDTVRIASTYNAKKVVVNGGDGNDVIYGSDQADQLYGGAGDDLIFGNGGDDRIVGGDGNDYLDGGAGNDKIWGQAGNDVLVGGLGNDYLDGGDGNDVLYGGLVPTSKATRSRSAAASDGDDTLLGGAGYDQLDGGTGNNVMDAGYDGIHEVMRGSQGKNTGYIHMVRGRPEDALSSTGRKILIRVGTLTPQPAPVPPGSATRTVALAAQPTSTVVVPQGPIALVAKPRKARHLA